MRRLFIAGNKKHIADSQLLPAAKRDISKLSRPLILLIKRTAAQFSMLLYQVSNFELCARRFV